MSRSRARAAACSPAAPCTVRNRVQEAVRERRISHRSGRHRAARPAAPPRNRMGLRGARRERGRHAGRERRGHDPGSSGRGENGSGRPLYVGAGPAAALRAPGRGAGRHLHETGARRAGHGRPARADGDAAPQRARDRLGLGGQHRRHARGRHGDADGPRDRDPGTREPGAGAGERRRREPGLGGPRRGPRRARPGARPHADSDRWRARLVGAARRSRCHVPRPGRDRGHSCGARAGIGRLRVRCVRRRHLRANAERRAAVAPRPERQHAGGNGRAGAARNARGREGLRPGRRDRHGART